MRGSGPGAVRPARGTRGRRLPRRDRPLRRRRARHTAAGARAVARRHRADIARAAGRVSAGGRGAGHGAGLAARRAAGGARRRCSRRRLQALLLTYFCMGSGGHSLEWGGPGCAWRCPGALPGIVSGFSFRHADTFTQSDMEDMVVSMRRTWLHVALPEALAGNASGFGFTSVSSACKVYYIVVLASYA